jgi:hypothetical protein
VRNDPENCAEITACLQKIEVRLEFSLEFSAVFRVFFKKNALNAQNALHKNDPHRYLQIKINPMAPPRQGSLVVPLVCHEFSWAHMPS